MLAEQPRVIRAWKALMLPQAYPQKAEMPTVTHQSPSLLYDTCFSRASCSRDAFPPLYTTHLEYHPQGTGLLPPHQGMRPSKPTSPSSLCKRRPRHFVISQLHCYYLSCPTSSVIPFGHQRGSKHWLGHFLCINLTKLYIRRGFFSCT